ncbi:hypothetical protein DICVIV_02464 [Dictyocaulus viviparus]|uniref:Peptidase S1 domain-containing protein n=1 Tax=Dictyocaulus viviparus TaxID=29172 RepID=A0A0D8Y3Q9_DICVI|nr:hypothetical protein DICVIV_02464 [Dictyocaulus viviparus]
MISDEGHKKPSNEDVIDMLSVCQILLTKLKCHFTQNVFKDNLNVNKVMGGRRATLGELPWSILIETTDKLIICGGTLIGRKHVITAAHCFWKNSDVETCTPKDMYRIEEVRRLMKVMVGGICRKIDEKNDCSDAETVRGLNVMQPSKE